MVNTDTQTWIALSGYESTDILDRLYRATQGRGLSTRWLQEIASSFAQGREYFAAAKVSGPLVRPVLQYYGVLAQSRALIQFSKRNVGNAELEEAHGVSAGHWRETLANPETALNIALTATRGTFTALAKATDNKDVITVDQKLGFSYEHELKWPTAGLEDVNFTLDEVLARTADLVDVYMRSTQKIPSVFPATFSATRGEMVWLGVTNLEPKVDKAHLRKSLGIHGRLVDSVVSIASTRTQEIYQHSFCAPYGADWEQLIPQLECLSDGSLAVSAAFSNGVRLSRMMRLFLLSAFLGNYCRYYPAPWLLAVQGRAKGDFIMPLIRAAMDLIDTDFPLLILRELEGRLT